MESNHRFSRRDLLRLMGLFATAYLTRGCVSYLPGSGRSSLGEPQSLINPDLELSLKAAPASFQIQSGELTKVWQYQGEVLSGPEDALVNISGSYLGPIIHARQGQRVRVHFLNDLPEPTIIHWHGLHVPPSADGHPRLAIDPGDTYTYDFEVLDKAGTYWYHPHPHGRTGPQVYAGLAGLFLIHDQEEDEIGLPGGKFDLPLVIQDRTFNNENQLVYGTGQMMERMVGFLGNRILINGDPEFKQTVETRPYRVRLLNGSNSRIYKIAREDGVPLVVLGTDGGLLDRPIRQEAVTLAPAQRIELWLDFGPLGDEGGLKLVNLPFEGFGGEAAYPLVEFEVIGETRSEVDPPEILSALNLHSISDAVNQENPRNFQLNMGPGMVWTLNGRTFEMDEVARNEIVKLNDLEVWEFENQAGMGMGMMSGMSLPHPIHLHGLQFMVIDRSGPPSLESDWGSLGAGFVDQGWHDTVLVRPGERVRILAKFKDFSGLYLYHCHNLEHEDMGMMRNYRVV